MNEEQKKKHNEARAARRAERSEEQVRYDVLVCAFGAEGLKRFCEEWEKETREIRGRKKVRQLVGRRCRT